MNKFVKWLIGIAIVVVIGGIIVVNQGNKNSQDNGNQLVINEKGVAVTAVSPQKESISDLLFTIGSVEPVTTYNVTAKATANVEKTYFEVGDQVQKDDVLFELENDTFSVSKNTTLAQLQNALTQAKQAKETAEKNLSDQQQLFDSGAISQAQLDGAKTQYDNAVLAYNNALNNYRSNSATLSDQSEYYIQKSPVAGIITAKTIFDGQLATTQNGYTIMPVDAYVVKSSVSSNYINQVAKGQNVDLYVNSIDKHYSGKVKSISDISQNGAFPVEISIDGDDTLKSGFYAEVKIQIDKHDEALTIPTIAIQSNGNESYVFVANAEMKAEKKVIETGIKEGDRTEVLSGISQEDTVILKGKEFLDEGSVVVIK